MQSKPSVSPLSRNTKKSTMKSGAKPDTKQGKTAPGVKTFAGPNKRAGTVSLKKGVHGYRLDKNELVGPGASAVAHLAFHQRELEDQVRMLRTQVLRQSIVLDALRPSRVTFHSAPAAVDSSRAGQALADMQRRLGLDLTQDVEFAEELDDRSETAKRRWIAEGLLVGSTDMGAAWGRSRQALEQAVDRGELFSLKIANRRWYPAVFARLDPDTVKTVCTLLHDVDPVSQFIFWERTHGSLGGRTIEAALRTGDMQAGARAAEAFAREQLLHAAPT